MKHQCIFNYFILFLMVCARCLLDNSMKSSVIISILEHTRIGMQKLTFCKKKISKRQILAQNTNFKQKNQVLSSKAFFRDLLEKIRVSYCFKKTIFYKKERFFHRKSKNVLPLAKKIEVRYFPTYIIRHQVNFISKNV